MTLRRFFSPAVGISWVRKYGRVSLVLALTTGFLGLLGARLVDVQLVRGSTFRLAAEENRMHSLPLPAERGLILDRYGQPLVWNTRRYFKLQDANALYSKLAPTSREDALALLATDSGRVVQDWVREYRWAESLSHILGYVGKVTSEELQNGLANGLNEQVGKMGLELVFQRQLRGKAGRVEYEVNALGQRQKSILTIPAEAGTSLTTTLDPYLSEVAYRALAGQKGTVIIMDGETAAVLSLVSSPAFNANLLAQPALDGPTEVQRRQQLAALFTDSRQLFFNRAVSGNYPPGSVFKLITALAGLEANAFQADTKVIDEGVLKVGEYEYRNWFFRQYGRTDGEVDVVKAIARSNDIFFYKAAEWIGPSRLAELARLFGLGSPTEIGLGGEAKGLVPDPSWKEQNSGEKWFLGNTYHMGIGQGDLLVTPIQIANLLQTLTHNGLRCQPSVVAGQRPVCTQVTINDQSWQLVLKGMLDACSPGGTAFPFFTFNQARRQADSTVAEDITRGAIACKTGTAEFGAQDAQGNRRTHGWFVGAVHIEPTATASAAVATSSAQTTSVLQRNAYQLSSPSEPVSYDEWRRVVQQQPLPNKLVFVALVESDDTQPFREGSADAAPVVKKIIDWMMGQTVM